MMKQMRSLYIVLCLMVGMSTLSGCIEEFEADIPADDSDLLVVEGAICSSRVNTFVLSRTQALNSSDELQKVVGAHVSVRGSDGSEYLAQGVYGQYVCQVGVLSPDVEYYLHIESDGEVYESEPQRPMPTEKVVEVTGVRDSLKNRVDVLVTPADPFEPDRANYYSWTCDETWEVHSDYTTNMYFDKETMKRVYQANLFPHIGWKDATAPTIMVGASSSYKDQHIRRLKMYDIDCSNERIYYRYSGLVHQRAISKAEYEYEMARRQAGSEMGGLFTPQPSALPTNIHCLTSDKHVIGFVGCSLNTSEYRFFLDAKELSIQIPQREDSRLWLEDCTEDDCALQVDKGMFLCEWEDNRISFGSLKTAWAFDWQLDVRSKGAYIEEPDFWSLEGNVSY